MKTPEEIAEEIIDRAADEPYWTEKFRDLITQAIQTERDRAQVLVEALEQVQNEKCHLTEEPNTLMQIYQMELVARAKLARKALAQYKGDE